MKFRYASLICLLTFALSASLGDAPTFRPPIIRHIPVVAPNKPPTPTVPAATPAPEELPIKPENLRRDLPVERVVILQEPPPRWILSDKTWRSINESLVNVDVCLDRGQEYFGVRIVLPFGS